MRMVAINTNAAASHDPRWSRNASNRAQYVGRAGSRATSRECGATLARFFTFEEGLPTRSFPLLSCGYRQASTRFCLGDESDRMGCLVIPNERPESRFLNPSLGRNH